MYGATPAEGILVFFVCLLPAAAAILAVSAGLLVSIQSSRVFSLVLAVMCIAVYVLAALLCIYMPFRQLASIIDSLPAGRLFRSFIPLVAAIIIICFDIYTLKKIA